MSLVEYLSPDYSGINDEDDDEFDDDVLEEDDEDESVTETILDNTLKEENKMFEDSTGNQQSNSNSSSIWNSGSNSPWTNNSGSSIWQQNNNSSPWGSSLKSSPWGSGTSTVSTKSEINRNKKFIFCDFLDCLVETYQSNGNPGLLPRDIYDIKPRFNVWSRISAFNPEKVFITFPTNFIPNTNSSNWEFMLTYFTKSLEAFIRSSGNTCTVNSIAYSLEQNPKGNVIAECINTLGIKKEDSIYIGVYSGGNGQSNVDLMAANFCGIDYVDLNNLLNNMY